MKITYQGLNITHPIQGAIQTDDFVVSFLNAVETSETLSAEEQAANFQFEQERRELLEKIINEQDSKVKEELQAQLDELDAKEIDRHNQKAVDQLVAEYEQKREAQFTKVKIGGFILVALIVAICFIIFKRKSRKKVEKVKDE